MLKGIKLSKKLTIAVISALVILISDLLNIKIDDATLQNIAVIVATYLVGQSAIDVSKTITKTKDEIIQQVIKELLTKKEKNK